MYSLTNFPSYTASLAWRHPFETLVTHDASTGLQVEHVTETLDSRAESPQVIYTLCMQIYLQIIH